MALLAVMFTTSCTKSQEALVIPEEDKIAMVSDNLSNSEMEVGTMCSYLIELDKTTDSENEAAAIVWYVNDEVSGYGTEFEFTPEEVGENEVKYVINHLYSSAGIEITREIAVDVINIVASEDKVNILRDNIYYNETQLTVEQNYWVVLAKDHDEADTDKSIKWYVNNEFVRGGVDFQFTPEAVGEYIIKYVVFDHYSTTDKTVSKETMVKVFSSKGVYILNEPNMTAVEEMRGINKHIFGSKTVDRFIIGDYNSFGTTNQYIENWNGVIYNVAPFAQEGVIFSSFDAIKGTFLKAVKSIPGSNTQANTFVGVTPELGVLATSNGAYLVNLSDFTLSSAVLKGSESAYDLFVRDGYLFIIASDKAIAYKIDNLSTDTEPTILGDANTGFVQSKDGYVWAANGNTLLRINTKDLSVEEKSLPNDVEITFPQYPWKHVSWVASTTENTFFFTRNVGWSSKAICKYDIETGTINEDFVLSSEEMDNYMIYGTALLFNPELDELICQTLKGWGADSAFSGIHMFNSKSGAKNSEVLYNTKSEKYGDKDMWFPAMMSPIKTY